MTTEKQVQKFHTDGRVTKYRLFLMLANLELSCVLHRVNCKPVRKAANLRFAILAF